MTQMLGIDALVGRCSGSGEFAPYWGWHDDHRDRDRTPEYLPALQQVRGEYAEFLGQLDSMGTRFWPVSCLQLGMGATDASHRAWQLSFGRVVTIDFAVVAVGDRREAPGLDVLSDEAYGVAREHGPYDLVFCDANHRAGEVAREFELYSSLLRPGGVVAFHDAIRRPGYEEEVTVWRFLEALRQPVNLVGREVGIAWLRP